MKGGGAPVGGIRAQLDPGNFDIRQRGIVFGYISTYRTTPKETDNDMNHMELRRACAIALLGLALPLFNAPTAQAEGDTFCALPGVQVSDSARSEWRSDFDPGLMVFKVTLAPQETGTYTVQYKTVSGLGTTFQIAGSVATAGDDYQHKTGTLTLSGSSDFSRV